jgi:hypothetical protein
MDLTLADVANGSLECTYYVHEVETYVVSLCSNCRLLKNISPHRGSVGKAAANRVKLRFPALQPTPTRKPQPLSMGVSRLSYGTRNWETEDSVRAEVHY